jgi:hypothetical protein
MLKRRTNVTRDDGFRTGGAAATTVIRVPIYRWRRRRYNPASPAPINNSVDGSGVALGDPEDDPPPPITPTLGAASGASWLSPESGGAEATGEAFACPTGEAAPLDAPGLLGREPDDPFEGAAAAGACFSTEARPAFWRSRPRVAAALRKSIFASDDTRGCRSRPPSACPAAAIPAPPASSSTDAANPTVNRGALPIRLLSRDELVPTRPRRCTLGAVEKWKSARQ